MLSTLSFNFHSKTKYLKCSVDTASTQKMAAGSTKLKTYFVLELQLSANGKQVNNTCKIMQTLADDLPIVNI
jgi:type II secretory pathway component PulL